jgi:DNA-binding SARP family transcriptional activator
MPGSPRPDRSAEGRLSLVTLGEPGLYLHTADGEARLLDAGKPLALLIYLACARGREATRDYLIELLWAHLEHDRAQSGLRQAVWQIKNRLGDAAISATRDRVALVAPVQCDRDGLIAAAGAGDIERVVDLYRGDFVSGFAAPGGSSFDEWAELERATLRRLFLRAAAEVVNDRLATGKARDAIALARRARDADPLNQRAWRSVLESLIAGGDAIGARTEADALNYLLEQEDIEPDPATRSLLRTLRESDVAAVHEAQEGSPDLVAELVGREREFAAVVAAWAGIDAGHVRRFHIVAPAGLGKTRLLLDLRNRLRASGGRAVYLRADFVARDIPFAFVSDITARLARMRGGRGISAQSASTLVTLNPALSAIYPGATPDSAGDDEVLRRRTLALRELVSSVADDDPIALLIDDLHWSDAHSFRMLIAALNGIEKSRLLVVTAARPPLDRVVAFEAITMELTPLDADDVAELLSSLAELPPDSWTPSFVQSLADTTRGSPLLIVETIRLLMENELLVLADERWITPDPGTLSRAISEEGALRRRLAALAVDEYRVLLILAVAGMPISRELLDDVMRSSNISTNGLIGLERRGLVRCDADTVTVHDEHAATVVETADPPALARVASLLGRALLRRAGRDPHGLSVAATLLARDAANNRVELADTFAEFARVRRLAADRRSDRLLARELLGPSTSDDLERTLVNGLPWLVRARLVSRARITATLAVTAVLLLATTIAAAVLERPARPPDGVVVATHLSSDRQYRDVSAIDLDVARWPAQPVIALGNERPRWRIKAVLGNGGRTVRPDGRGWTMGIVVPDSGLIDLFDLWLDGSVRRITYAAKDDYGPSWSPDNTKLVFSTSRWSRGGAYDLAIYDTLTHETRQLTSGDDTDGSPSWSLDGSRIAFVRRYAVGGAVSLCVVDVSGDNPRCFPDARDASIGIAGWLDAHRILMRRTRGALVWTEELSVETGIVGRIDEGNEAFSVSPDGRFAICRCTRPGYEAGAAMVYRVDTPGEFAILHLVGDSTAAEYGWAPTSPRAPYVVKLAIAQGLGDPFVGVPHQLRVSAKDASGKPTDAGVIRWLSKDTTIATVDSTGRLSPLRAGRVTVDASAGGWRTVRASITIRDRAAQVVFDESWNRALEPTWILFGQPRPKLVSDPTIGNTFLNNGDGTFFSGGYTSRAFDTSDGLWLETDVSARLTRSESQEQVISLVHIVDSVAWAHWDRVTGDGPVGEPSRHFSIRYPYGPEVRHRGEQLLITGVPGEHFVTVPPTAFTGRPMRVVMQIFPDGRCALALDGKPVWSGDAAFFDRSARVMLAGNSVDTRVLVGRLRVGSGVYAGVEWTRARGQRPTVDRR